MKKLHFLLKATCLSACLLIYGTGWGQSTWSYNFGTSTDAYTTASNSSTTFLPAPETNGGTSFIRLGNAGGSFNLETSGTGIDKIGSGARLRIEAPTGTSVNKFSIYDYTAGKAFYTKFSVLFGGNDGSDVSTGSWLFFQGSGGSYSTAVGFAGAQTFTGLQFAYGSSGEITTSYRNAGSWTSLGTSIVDQGNVYTFEIFGNNSTATINYTYNGSSRSLDANKQDIWVNGVLVVDGLSKALLPDDTDINAFMFYGVSSTGNEANIFLDDITYSNYVAASYTTNMNYYSKSSGVINNANNFTANVNGTGTINPANFTNNYATYNIRNNAAPAIDANWVVSGTNSKVVLGNGVNLCGFETDYDVEFANLHINEEASLTIKPEKLLEVTNTLTNDEGIGGLIVESDNTGTGIIIHNSTNVDATVQKYLPDNTTTGWYLSSPVTLADYSMFNSSDGLWAYNAVTPLWEAVSSGTLAPMVGYVTKYDGQNVTVEFEGQLNSGTISNSALVRNGSNYGWNLVGNPYPSPIDWDANPGINLTNINSTIYYRKADGNAAYWVRGTPGIGNNGGTNIVPAMQAFWVQVEPGQTNGTLELTNEAQVNQTNNLLKTNPSDILRLTIERDNHTDECVVRFVAGATDLFDNSYDASKMFSLNDVHPQIYSLNTAANELAINTFSLLTTNKTIELGFKTNHSGSHTISADGLSSFDNAVGIHLEDLDENILIDLRQQNSYTFNSSDITTNDRFVVHFILTTTDAEALTKEDIVTSIFSNEKNIYLSNIQERVSVSVFNLLGQEVISEQLESAGLSKITTSLSTGQYVVRVTGSNGSITEKIFIN